MTPSTFKPSGPAQMIGTAAAVARLLANKAQSIKATNSGNIRALFFGAPGTGKTDVAKFLARILAGHELAIEQVNGQSMSVDLVRDWRRNSCYRPLYGDRIVKHVDEIDRSSEAAQAELLTFIDQLPPFTDIIVTTNLELEQLAERVQTRFVPYRFKPVDADQLAGWLTERWPITPQTAKRIATANKGNVRACLLDVEAELDRMAMEAAA